MSKWKILRQNLNLNRHADSKSDLENESVHRFHGFQNLFKSKKIVWSGFKVKYKSYNAVKMLDIMNIESFLSECKNLVIGYNTSHIIFQIETSENNFTLLNQIVSENQKIMHFLNIKRDNHLVGNIISLELCVTNPLYNPIFKYYQYVKREILYMNTSYNVYTREKGENMACSIKGLLSNHLYGIDNTGNVCVWPSESLLLHTILNNEKYFKFFENKRVLELGGGMTSLCGITLAVLNICNTVIITDGHPDCVTNQEFCIRMNQNINDPTNCQLNIDITNHSSSSITYIGSNKSKIHAHQLRWSVNDETGDLQNILDLYSDTKYSSIHTPTPPLPPSSSPLDDSASQIISSETNTPYMTQTQLSAPLVVNNTMKNQIGCFHTIIACDILFFVDFHDSLIYVLRHALIPKTARHHCSKKDQNKNLNNSGEYMEPVERNIQIIIPSIKPIEQINQSLTLHEAPPIIAAENHGTSINESTVFLLQPKRGKSMDIFIEKASKWFDITIEDNYDSEISHYRNEYLETQNEKQAVNLSGKPLYDEDIHFPILLILKLK